MRKIQHLYRALRVFYGPQNWWPAKTSFEVVVGAYLTQNTAWGNVEKALTSLRKAGKLNVEGIRSLSLQKLQQLIRASGFFRQKSRSLKAFIQYLDARHAGSLRRMFARYRATPAALHALRDELLTLNGVGRETADSILLYGGNLPVFVVDAYTRRIFTRHGIVSETESYEEIRELVEKTLAALPGIEDNSPQLTPSSRHRHLAQHFNEMHALLVSVGKDHCYKSTPNCEGCPLRQFLPHTASEIVPARKARSAGLRSLLKKE
ncbi:MAG TPA: base excision DNA repair protein [Terriglobales bacterium]|nr:base excision DNA repair protein [Terriglobales bacterium]